MSAISRDSGRLWLNRYRPHFLSDDRNPIDFWRERFDESDGATCQVYVNFGIVDALLATDRLNRKAPERFGSR